MAADNPACRLLVEDEPHDGCWNMAYDEALLEAAANRGETILRIYRWSEPTLSLGYFQRSRATDLPEALRSLPQVRRLSGGGAILHDQEWTYSCAIPKSHPFARRAEILYKVAHLALIEAFARRGIAASLRGESIRQPKEQFLCFQREDPRDVLVRNAKVTGSAQRRRRGAVLQHGSVLLRRSPLAPDVFGLGDLVPNVPNESLFGASDFVDTFGSKLFGREPVRESHPADTERAGERAAIYVIS